MHSGGRRSRRGGDKNPIGRTPLPTGIQQHTQNRRNSEPVRLNRVAMSPNSTSIYNNTQRQRPQYIPPQQRRSPRHSCNIFLRSQSGRPRTGLRRIFRPQGRLSEVRSTVSLRQPRKRHQQMSTTAARGNRQRHIHLAPLRNSKRVLKQKGSRPSA